MSRFEFSTRLVIGALSLVASVAFTACEETVEAAKPKQPPPTPTVAVTAATAWQGDISVHLLALGTVTPVATSSITS